MHSKCALLLLLSVNAPRTVLKFCFAKFMLPIRMHSSRMRTGRSLTICLSLLPRRGGPQRNKKKILKKILKKLKNNQKIIKKKYLKNQKIKIKKNKIKTTKSKKKKKKLGR